MQPLHVTIVGSKLYGTATENSDTDFKGFAFAHKSEVLGLGSFEQQEYSNDVSDGPSKIEGTIYEIRRYFRLCMKGNPTVLEISFADPKFSLYTTSLGNEITGFVRDNLIQKDTIFKSYSAYHMAQMRKLESMQREGKRKEIVDEYGYDIKFCYHAYRLGIQCKLLMETGYIQPSLTDEYLQIGNDIRKGAYTKEKAITLLKECDTLMYEAYKCSNIPNKLNYQFIDDYLQNLYLRYFNGEFNFENIFSLPYVESKLNEKK